MNIILTNLLFEICWLHSSCFLQWTRFIKFFEFLDNRHPNIKFTIGKQINHSITFLDVFISGINNQNLVLQTYHKSTYTGLLISFKSFTSYSYKISLIKCLIDRFLIDKVINKYLDYKFSSNQIQLKDKSGVHLFKLPYIGNLSHHIKVKLLKLCKEFCKENFNISF